MTGVHNVIVAGVGGQGNVLASQVIAAAAVAGGFTVAVGETFGASQRGGSVMSHVRIARDQTCGPLIPRGQAHVIVGFEPLETLRTLAFYGGGQTAVIMNLRPTPPLAVITGERAYPEMGWITEAVRANCRRLVILPATDLALAAGVAAGTNMVMTGAFAALREPALARESYGRTIGELFAGPLREANLRAFRAGWETVAGEEDLPGRDLKK